ncbi:MAG: hypothetical protein L3J97_02725 [Thermoplasmata archaeon]|nr:hypothetical protein [Thermoplasmata archaeon]
MTDDYRLESVVRYAVRFLGGIALLATGVWLVTPTFASLAQCYEFSQFNCPTLTLWVLAGVTLAGGAFLIAVSVALFWMARNVARTMRPVPQPTNPSPLLPTSSSVPAVDPVSEKYIVPQGGGSRRGSLGQERPEEVSHGPPKASERP